MATDLLTVHESLFITQANNLFVKIENANAVQNNEAPRWVHETKNWVELKILTGQSFFIDFQNMEITGRIQQKEDWKRAWHWQKNLPGSY